MTGAEPRPPAPGRLPRALAVVPARLASTRLPRKMLLRETGRFLFEHTVRNVEASGACERVVLATDSEEVLEAARAAGVEALLTSPDHPSGTDRVQEAVERLAERGEGPWEVVVNVQGDEPELPHTDLRRLVEAFRDEEVRVATLHAPLDRPEEAADPAVVKVVLDARGDALYFSRAPIPARAHGGALAEHRRHVGVYAFRPAALLEFTRLERGRLEATESLEQLRWLEAGRRMRVVEATGNTVGIDRAEDYAGFVERAKRQGQSDEGEEGAGGGTPAGGHALPGKP